MVVVHPALHRDAGLRVRVRVRPAARAVGLRAVRGARRRLRAAVSRPAAGRRFDGAARSSGKLVDVDLADPGFWDRGLDIIERRLEETIAAAEASGRLS